MKHGRDYLAPADAHRLHGDRRTVAEQAIMERVVSLAGGVTPYLPECKDYVGWENANGDVVVMVRKTYMTVTGRAANWDAIRGELADRETTPNIEVEGFDILWETFSERPRRVAATRVFEPKAIRPPSRAAVRRDAAVAPAREVCDWDDDCKVWATQHGLCARHARELAALTA